jgi:hypothetical protein
VAAGSIKAVLDLRAQLESRDSARNASYDESVRFYAGTDLKTAKKQGFVAGIATALSSIFSAPAEEEDAELRTPINVIKGAVENKVAFLALPPTVRVIEPPDSLAPGGSGPPALAGAAPALPQEAGMAAQPGLPLPGAPPGLAPTLPGLPGESAPDWGLDLADRLEMIIRSLMDFSNMPKRCRDVAWSMACGPTSGTTSRASSRAPRRTSTPWLPTPTASN